MYATALLAVVLIVYALVLARRRRHRAAIVAAPLPDAWRIVLERNVRAYRLLPEHAKRALTDRLKVFVAEKNFQGCAGLEVTEEMKVTIAAFACLLVLHRPVAAYANVDSIFVYPSEFVAERTSYEGSARIVGPESRLGESWTRGPIVLAWDSVEESIDNESSGRNVVLHEFAHKLDEANASMDGVPPLGDNSRYSSWEKVMSREYAALRYRAATRQYSLLDYYGAQSPAEFFAVVTETYFELPGAMKEEHPELYAELGKFYGIDLIDGRVE